MRFRLQGGGTYLQIAAEKGRSTSRSEVKAAQLYVWNGYLASVVDRLTGEVEVVLRNFIDPAFREWNSSNPRSGRSDWLEHPEAELSEIVSPKKGRSLISYAHLDSVVGTPVHDDFVAGLTFGNWVHLLPKKHAGERNSRVILWNEALSARLRNPDRVSFQRNAMLVKDMRNRAVHRRPLVKHLALLERTHQSSVELISSVNSELGDWVKRERWIPSALQESPLIAE